MEILQAIVLGVVEGITEFLPISSTGHLIVAQDAMNYYDSSKLFTVVIQIGAIAAVIWHYRLDLAKITRGLVAGNKASRKFWLIWMVATIPAGIVGLMLDTIVEAYAITLTVALALIVGGVLILAIEKFKTVPLSSEQAKFDSISLRQALMIGFCQILALVPGISRSGATIMGGLLTGLDRVTATAFSFYMGIPILVIAGVFKLATEDISTVEGGWPAIIFGILASFVTALIVIKWLLRYISRHDFKLFAYYRIVFGVLLILTLYTEVFS